MSDFPTGPSLTLAAFLVRWVPVSPNRTQGRHMGCIKEDMAVGQVEMALRQDGRARMAGNTQAFLRNHAPFNKMQPDALQYFAEKAQIVFYAAGSEIVGPDSGKVRYFYLIESGKVQARQAGEVTVTEYSILSLGAGESFPIGAVTAGRPSTNDYLAVEDTFC